MPKTRREGSSEDPSGPAQDAASSLCDDRLALINFEHWTQVPISNLEAANAMSKYLQLDHPILGFFDADLVLDDLANNRQRFCSNIMINSLLSWAFVRTKPLPLRGYISLPTDIMSSA